MSNEQPSERIPACPQCGSSYEPVRPWQRFCSARCRTAAWIGRLQAPSIPAAWQPISTYRNDGSPVLGYSPWLKDAGIDGGLMVVHRTGPQPPDTRVLFTHWMPLPPTPEEP